LRIVVLNTLAGHWHMGPSWRRCRLGPVFSFVLALSCWLATGTTNAIHHNRLSASIGGRGQLGLFGPPDAIAASASLSRVADAVGLPAKGAAATASVDVHCLQNVGHRDPHDIGASTSAPVLYATRLGFQGCVAGQMLDVSANQDLAAAPVIFGGGSLFNQSFDAVNAKFLHSITGPLALWGVGFDDFPEERLSGPKMPAYLRGLDNLKLVGLRDFFQEDSPLLQSDDGLAPLLRWVPDASAMNLAFDQYLDPTLSLRLPPAKRSIGYVRPLNPLARAGCEPSGGDVTRIGLSKWLQQGLLTSQDVVPSDLVTEDMLKFLAESEVVIANSYHVIYWATLLGRKAVQCNRWSTALDHFKWPAVLYSGDLSHDVKQASSYPEAMREAREANMAFAEEVRYQMGLPGTKTFPGLFRPAEQAIRSSHTLHIIAIAVGVGLVGLIAVDSIRKRRSADGQELPRQCVAETPRSPQEGLVPDEAQPPQEG